MTLKSCWHNLCHGRWTQNRLMSRKFLFALGAVFVAVGLDISGRALGADTLNFARDVIIGYLAVQGAVDWKNNNSGGAV
jgi:hypothetical protein